MKLDTGPWNRIVALLVAILVLLSQLTKDTVDDLDV